MFPSAVNDSPREITGFQTHTTPVLLSFGEKAELASDECELLFSFSLGFCHWCFVFRLHSLWCWVGFVRCCYVRAVSGVCVWEFAYVVAIRTCRVDITQSAVLEGIVVVKKNPNAVLEDVDA